MAVAATDSADMGPEPFANLGPEDLDALLNGRDALETLEDAGMAHAVVAPFRLGRPSGTRVHSLCVPRAP